MENSNTRTEATQHTEPAIAVEPMLVNVNITKLRQKMFTNFYLSTQIDAIEVHKIIDDIFKQCGIY